MNAISEIKRRRPRNEQYLSSFCGFHLPTDLREKLEKSAKDRGLNISGEIRRRLESSFQNEPESTSVLLKEIIYRLNRVELCLPALIGKENR